MPKRIEFETRKTHTSNSHRGVGIDSVLPIRHAAADPQMRGFTKLSNLPSSQDFILICLTSYFRWPIARIFFVASSTLPHWKKTSPACCSTPSQPWHHRSRTILQYSFHSHGYAHWSSLISPDLSSPARSWICQRITSVAWEHRQLILQTDSSIIHSSNIS